MHYVGDDNGLLEASPEITPVPGGALCQSCQHKVHFAANINTIGAVDLSTADGKRLRSRILGLGYFDTASGESVLIAELKDSIGQILPSGNEVLYSDAFTNLLADVLYVNTTAGLEQDVILREQPPGPAAFGFDPRSTRLEVLTEFFDPPTPGIAPLRAASEAEAAGVVTGPAAPSIDDQCVDFGLMQMGPGKAFPLQEESDHPNLITIGKTWQNMEGRMFLVEQVEYPSIKPHFSFLPAPKERGENMVKASRSLQAYLRSSSPPRDVVFSTTCMLLSQFAPGNKGFVLDYALMTSQTNLVVKEDTTYYVSGSVYLSGNTVFEGGTVIKYATNAAIIFTPSYTSPHVTFASSAYRPVICTAKDDNSVGDQINGSTGTPQGYYANPAIALVGTQSGQLIPYIRIAYARQGIQMQGTSATISHAQFVYCQQGIAGSGAGITLRNVLFVNGSTNVAASGGGVTAIAENSTFAGSAALMSAPSGPTGCGLYLTNCILANVTNLWYGTLTSTQDEHNAFYQGPSFGFNIVPNPSSPPFVVVGDAGYYLCDNSPYRNAGTTNINPDLLKALRCKTTYPPVVYSNVLISADTPLGPQAQRDTDALDIGYHYDPIDYACNGLWLSNAMVQLLPGTALGTFGQYGIALWTGSDLISIGTPNGLNRIARYNLVQECSTGTWAGKGNSIAGDWRGGPVEARAYFRFTDWSMPAQDGSHFYTSSYDMLNAFQDCQFHGGAISIGTALALTNCLFERVNTSICDTSFDISPILRNCLFYGGELISDHANGGTWAFRDNLFDQTAITQWDGDVDGAYDAYTPGTARLTPTNRYDIVASITYQSGPLGNYCQATNSPFLNRGSTTADRVGLYHYTVLTNQVKEATNTVSIGYHYVAADSSGNPIDSSGDGIPDYLADSNGDGVSNAGDLCDWRKYNTRNGLTTTTPFTIFTPLR